MPTLRIDLVSDVVCPWCAVGYARLQQAMTQLGDELDIDLHWHPFLLNPDVGPDGRDMVEHLGAKYGKTADEVAQSQQELKSVAQSLGLHFEHFTERRSWNTFDTHRVLHYAREQGQDEALNLALFDAYFGDAANPTDPALLRRLAESVGLEGETVDAILAGDRHADVVSEEIAHYQQMGVQAVPSFIVNQQYLISGAQPPEALADGLRRIAAEAESGTA